MIQAHATAGQPHCVGVRIVITTFATRGGGQAAGTVPASCLAASLARLNASISSPGCVDQLLAIRALPLRPYSNRTWPD